MFKLQYLFGKQVHLTNRHQSYTVDRQTYFIVKTYSNEQLTTKCFNYTGHTPDLWINADNYLLLSAQLLYLWHILYLAAHKWRENYTKVDYGGTTPGGTSGLPSSHTTYLKWKVLYICIQNTKPTVSSLHMCQNSCNALQYLYCICCSGGTCTV